MSRTLTLRKSKSRPVAYADATKDWAAPKVETAKDWAAPKVETAKDWAAPKVEKSKDWAAPKVENGVEKVKTDVLPAVAGAVTAALAATEPVRTEAATRGTAALAALKGEVEAPKPKKHRIRKLFVLATVLGAAYAGWKAWASQQQSSDPVSPWTSDSTTSMSSVTPVRPATDDPGGAGPDEALADAVDEATAVEDGPVAAAEPVTEEVTPSNAKKVSDAAGKGATKKS